jgi:sugar phosphate permease
MADRATQARQRVGPALLVSILVPFGLGYFLSYLYRTVNAVAAPDLVRDVGVSASQLGFLTAVYLLAFAGSRPC